MVIGLFSQAYAYPALVGIMGSETLPDLKGRFLEGASGTVGENKEAGLPNITGWMQVYTSNYWPNPSDGAFYTTASNSVGESEDHSGLSPIFNFDASRCSSIYGNSTTVQPASYTVNYLIKAY